MTRFKSKFLTPLIAQRLKSGKWEIETLLEYQSSLLGEVVVIPAGFVTDYASVPRLPVVYFLAGNTAHEAAVVHDFLYWTQPVTRKTADRVFLEAMKVTRVSAWRRRLMYWAVRLGARRPWNKYRERINRNKEKRG